MEAVAPDALIIEPARQRVHARDCREGCVECGVEAGDLRKLRKFSGNEADARYRFGEMIGVERHELLEFAPGTAG